ncbi:MAG TPA: TonB family protein [Steroidobacteraceae bacterium]|nr:TonB family protein [Steroidobacteraceae bacterium]
MSSRPLRNAAAIESQSVFVAGTTEKSSKDRLVTIIFLVALFHIILITGITFIAPFLKMNTLAPTLEVLLLTDNSPSRDANPDAVYLAQRSQVGNGTTQKRERAANPASSPMAAMNNGTENGNSLDFAQALAGRAAVEVISSRAERASLAFQTGTDLPTHTNESPLALSPTPPNPITTSLLDDALRLRGKETRDALITPDTRESRLAPYLDGWKRKIEKVGTLNFPTVARRRLATRNPVVAVVITADGTLKEAVIQESSGDQEIDQAALNILRKAAPFNPFPTNLKKDYDQLRFAYEWQFLGEQH